VEIERDLLVDSLMGVMKTTTWQYLCVSVLASACTFAAYADEQVQASATRTEKSYSGVITSVDPKEKVMTVKGLMFSKAFNVADNCAIVAGGKQEVTLNEIRPGQKVNVNYKDVRGVFVAKRIVQEKMLYTGTVQSVDPVKRVLKVSRKGLSKTFDIPTNCKVVLKNDKSGGLNEVRVGHTITVVYETPHNAPVARQIEQTSATYVGTLDAIDASSRTVKAKHLIGERKFNLADNCKIIVNGKLNASLSDLRLGQKLEFSYDEVEGVNVVTRIGPAEGSTTGETALSGKTARQGQK
jgi:Cu/Ag efflux protein CusF